MVVRHSLYHRNAMPMKFENKMHVDWNGPKVGKADAIISESMNTYFKSENWHFKTGSTKFFTSKVDDRKAMEPSRLLFMEN
jgi:hypothetical protein